MTEIVAIDFTGCLEEAGPVIEPGEYRACIIWTGESTSKAGNPMLVLTWEIREDPCDGCTIRQWLAGRHLADFKEAMYGRTYCRGVEICDLVEAMLGVVGLITVETDGLWDHVTHVERDPDPPVSAFDLFWEDCPPRHRVISNEEYALNNQAIVMRDLAEVTAFYAAHGIVLYRCPSCGHRHGADDGCTFS